MEHGGIFEIYNRVCYTCHPTVFNKERTVVRCLSCNVELTDFESTRKSAETNEFIDLCNHCYAFVKSDIKAVERMDLMHEDDDNIFEADFLSDL
jgi:hypothetical protein